MLPDFLPNDAHAADRAASWLIEQAEAGLEAMIDDLFREAFVRWEDRAFERYSNDEVCCTVVFFDCCEQVIQSWESIFRMIPEHAQPTREMRAGREHPKTAVRPDLSLLVGRFTFRIEAKRLALRDGLPKEYVREGMRRFIDKKYVSTHGKPGYMLGYVVRDDPSEVVVSINRAIENEDDLSAKDQLRSAGIPHPRFQRYLSTHTPDLRLVHNMFDLRLLPASGLPRFVQPPVNRGGRVPERVRRARPRLRYVTWSPGWLRGQARRAPQGSTASGTASKIPGVARQPQRGVRALPGGELVRAFRAVFIADRARVRT